MHGCTVDHGSGPARRTPLAPRTATRCGARTGARTAPREPSRTTARRRRTGVRNRDAETPPPPHTGDRETPRRSRTRPPVRARPHHPGAGPAPTARTPAKATPRQAPRDARPRPRTTGAGLLTRPPGRPQLPAKPDHFTAPTGGNAPPEGGPRGALPALSRPPAAPSARQLRTRDERVREGRSEGRATGRTGASGGIGKRGGTGPSAGLPRPSGTVADRSRPTRSGGGAARARPACPAGRAGKRVRSSRPGPPPAGNEAAVSPSPLNLCSGPTHATPIEPLPDSAGQAHGRAHGHTRGARKNGPRNHPDRGPRARFRPSRAGQHEGGT